MRRPVARDRRDRDRPAALASPFLGVEVGQRRLPGAAAPTPRRTSPPTSSTPSSAARRPPPTAARRGADEADVAAYTGEVGGRSTACSTCSRSTSRGRQPRCCARPGRATARPRPARTRPGPPRRSTRPRRHGAGRRPDRRHRRPDRLGRRHLPWMGADRRRRDARAAVPRLRLAGAADQGGRDEPVLDHRVVRRGHLDLHRRPPRRACSASPRPASSTRPTRS